MRIIIESGLLYSISLLIVYIYQLFMGGFVIPFDPTVVPVQFSGIAPTIIIVRAGYHKSVVNVQQAIPTFQAAPAECQSFAIGSTVRIQVEGSSDADCGFESGRMV
ncbi:hypothetical protein AAF712_015357 [Marasmius tenuissimus]|uniref:Uncharacterized protein n=1 Tax=Marasmius tenuissimus TaxID=585030 RepID=A0ABR2ZAG1_9AGAR